MRVSGSQIIDDGAEQQETCIIIAREVCRVSRVAMDRAELRGKWPPTNADKKKLVQAIHKNRAILR